jgi:phosphate uptake regulator
MRTSDCLSYRVAVKSIERVADHASGIADKCFKIKEKISKEELNRIEKMSQMSLSVLNDSVEALLRRDYFLADNVVNKAENIRSFEEDTIPSTDKEEKIVRSNPTNVMTKLILQDIRRTAEHASDIAEAAMNQTIGEIIEKK